MVMGSLLHFIGYIMKLIHRMDLELTAQGDVSRGSLEVTVSFYRPFLDGAYRVMITHMMDTGCFDAFMKSVLNQLLSPGRELQKRLFRARTPQYLISTIILILILRRGPYSFKDVQPD